MAQISFVSISKKEIDNSVYKLKIEVEYTADEPSVTYTVLVRLYSSDKYRSHWMPPFNFQTTPQSIVVPSDNLYFETSFNAAEIEERLGSDFCGEAFLVNYTQHMFFDSTQSQLNKPIV